MLLNTFTKLVVKSIYSKGLMRIWDEIERLSVLECSKHLTWRIAVKDWLNKRKEWWSDLFMRQRNVWDQRQTRNANSTNYLIKKSSFTISRQFCEFMTGATCLVSVQYLYYSHSTVVYTLKNKLICSPLCQNANLIAMYPIYYFRAQQV